MSAEELVNSAVRSGEWELRQPHSYVSHAATLVDVALSILATAQAERLPQAEFQALIRMSMTYMQKARETLMAEGCDCQEVH